MAIRQRFIVLFLIFVTLGLYYPSIFAGAASVDDVQMITSYLNIDRVDLKGTFLPGTSGYYYRPLLGLTYIFDRFVWDMHESFMHMENVIFHTINVILVYFISIKVARRYDIENSTLPVCAALLFAVHPINTESVNWISGRTDLLAGIFILLSILLLLNALQGKSTILMSGAASASFLLSCFAKEVAVCALPGLLFLVIFYDQNVTLVERLRKRWVCSAFLSATAMTYFLFRFFAFKRGDTGIKTVATAVNAPTFDLLDTLRIVLKVYGFYVKKIFFPLPLNFAIVSISDYYVVVGVILVFFISYMLYKRNLVSALFLISICVTAPALLVALAKLAWTPIAERYLYLPCATFCIAMSVLLYPLFISKGTLFKNISYFCVTSLFVFSAYSTVNRNLIWQNNITLFQETLRSSPGFFLAQNALAHALQQQGRNTESRELMLSMVAPEGSKRGGKLVDGNRAQIMAADGDLVGAKKLLLRNIEDSGVLYATNVDQIIDIDMTLLEKERDSRKAKELQQEIVSLLLKLQEKNNDPFYYYRIGQFYLHMGDKLQAQRYFAQASLNSSEGTHYKQAAAKLAEKLKQ